MLWFAVGLLLLAAGCRSTNFATTWKDPAVDHLAFKDVVVVVLNSTPAERRAQEDVIVAQIKRTKATPSYQLLSDEELKDVPAAKQKIIDAGFDGAVVLRLVSKEQETTYVPAQTNWDSQWNAPNYYGTTQGRVVTDTVVRAEVDLYSVPQGRLLWAGSSDTLNPTGAAEFAKEVAEAAAAELKKQGLIQ
jgi:hypothetical protein